MRRAGLSCLRRRMPGQLRQSPLLQTRALSITNTSMASSIRPANPPLPGTHPTDAFQLLPEAEKSGVSEDAVFEEQVKQVREWWASPRYKGIKRPYSPEAVVSKRGTLQQVYPSSLMARKLFDLFNERASKGEPVHTSK